MFGAIIAAGAVPLAAQTAPAPATTNSAAPPPASNDSIGPAQLRDFSLNGTVTRRADPPPAAEPPQSVPKAATRVSPSPRSEPAAGRTVRDRPAQRAPAEARAPASDVTIDVARSPGVGAVLPPAIVDVRPDRAASARSPSDSSREPARWPWLFAALAAALGGAFFLWQRRARSAAGDLAYASDAPVATVPPRPAPAPAARAPSPAAPSPATGAIVARGLKPSLSFELVPLRVETDGAGAAALVCEVTVRNNGSAPARDVLVEAQMFNAGPRQDEDIGRFFREPNREGSRIDAIQPMAKVTVKSRIVIPADQLVPVVVEERQLLVPLVAFNALYRWSGGEEQDSASFLVGKGDPEAGRMAPFRLDRGARSYAGLGARIHSLGLERA